MVKLSANGPVFFFLMIAVSMSQGCRKEPFSWNPDADLIMKPDSGLTTQTFDFRIDMRNLPASQEEFYIRWDLNGDSVWDQSFSASPTITRRFYQKGIHPVKAEILTEDGQRFTLTRNVNVGQGYSAPHAGFTIDPPGSNFLTEFTFDAGTTFDDEDPLSSLLFRWDFEDGGVWDTEPSSGTLAKHKYQKPGQYTIKLSVTDPTRRTSTLTKVLVVDLHDELIRPDFSWTPQEGTVKDTFFLDATATRHESDPEREFSYVWDIQSELTYGPFTDPVFSHVFRSAGMQKVTLTATDQHGLSNSSIKEFFVIKENKPPSPKIFVATPYGNIATNFFFHAWLSLDDVTPPSQLLLRWDFDGDGKWDTGWSYEKELFHQFSEPGEFWVNMEAEDEGGEKATTKTRILVSPYAVQTGFIKDKRDGKYYGTVKIGEQWWMSDNLDFRTNPKLDIPMLQQCYDEAHGMCDLYGSLYQGERSVVYVNAGKNVCPEGWRLPTKEDWMELGDNIPATGARDAMMVGGSVGFNARYTGSGHFEFVYDPITDNIVDTLYYFKGLYEEVKFLSLTTRPYLSEYHSQFYMGLIRIADAVDLMWGDLNGYFYARCLRED